MRIKILLILGLALMPAVATAQARLPDTACSTYFNSTTNAAQFAACSSAYAACTDGGTSSADCASVAQQAGINAAPAPTSQGATQSGPTDSNCPPGTPPGGLCYVPLAPVDAGEQQALAGDPNLAAFLNFLFPILITLGALIGVGTFVFYGILYMVSAAAPVKGNAAARMRGSIYGLILLLASILILNTVDPALTKFNLSELGVLKTQQAGGQSLIVPKSQ